MYRANILFALGIAALAPSTAHAQWGNYYQQMIVPGGLAFIDSGTSARPNDTFVSVVTPGSIGSCTGTCSGYVALSAFSPVSPQVIQAMTNQMGKAIEIGAIAAAMKDAIPNPGDRFAVRLNAAAFNSYGAGAIGFSYTLTDRARLSINYGQGRSQGVVSGGMNFSFQ